MSISLTQYEVKQIEADEPKTSQRLFKEYLEKNISLTKLAENNGIKIHQIKSYSKLYKYVARKKYYQNLKNRYPEHNLIQKHRYQFKLCPECQSCNLTYDFFHGELYCTKCGLVILAPPSADTITDGYLRVVIDTNFSNMNVVVVPHE